MSKQDLLEKVSEIYSKDLSDEDLDKLLEAVDAYRRIYEALKIDFGVDSRDKLFKLLEVGKVQAEIDDLLKEESENGN